MFQTYFKNLFTSLTPSRQSLDDYLQQVQPKVIEFTNVVLTRRNTNEEIKEDLMQMAPLKSPSPNGFNANFIQAYWHVVGTEVSSMTLNFLNYGIFDKYINQNFIVLIPKINSLTTASDFKPISLYNVIYKLISKTIANKLKLILPSIISHTQSAFISKRLISNNVIVAYEALHIIKSRKKCHIGHMVVKLDISKAYDRVEFIFFGAYVEEIGL